MRKHEIVAMVKRIKNEASIGIASAERLKAAFTHLDSECETLLQALGEQPGGGRKAPIELSPEDKLHLRQGNRRTRPSEGD